MIVSEQIKDTLREAYDRRAAERAKRPAPAWELAERDRFGELVVQEGKTRLLDLGAGTGIDARHFADVGLDVVCVDLSPKMVEACREKALEAHVMDVSDLRFDSGSFDAIYAMNCLVHLPNLQIEKALEAIFDILQTDGLFYVGLYGGRRFEGIWEDDSYEPKRFFSHYPDDELTEVFEQRFDVEAFRQIGQGWAGLHFQSLVLRKRSGPPQASGVQINP